jgi:3',5'-cyclic AMP phosphodiesterase CpdA
MKLAITADLHWGHRKGAEPTRQLAARLLESPPDVLILAGDVGTGVYFEECLKLFDGLRCIKAVIPGNHDLWVPVEETRYDSLDLYQKLLPEAAARQGFTYLDRGPLALPDGLTMVGSINWYDYSWGIDAIRRLYPGQEGRLKTKRFTRGRHNDGVFVRWPTDDPGFTALVTAALERHLQAASAQAGKLLVVTHHPPFYDLGFPHPDPTPDLDRFLWDSFCGNAGVEQLLARFADRIAFAFCGHTHRAREMTWRGVRGYNVGSDYPFKRLLWLDWPSGAVTAEQFGEG